MPVDLPPVSDPYVVTQSVQLQDFQPTAIVISCGTGRVSISLKDGRVTIDNCNLDESAKAFWKAVEMYAPMKPR